jgi:molybdopterin/thiamine biosynthesis adenylyltransferase/rhodanese-related sulfurtransferase
MSGSLRKVVNHRINIKIIGVFGCMEDMPGNHMALYFVRNSVRNFIVCYRNSYMLTAQELRRYNRQILLPELGTDGQERLKNGKVLVIGAGGLGSPALLYLAAAGVGTIGILDFDKVDESNLQRQILYGSADAGLSKVARAAERLHELNPIVIIRKHEVMLNAANALEIFSPYDVVIDGSDNLPTRYLVNDACIILRKTLIYGAIFQFEGHVSVFNQPNSDGKRGPNYRDLFPEPPPPEMVPSCNVSGVLGTLPGIIGSMQASEAIKVLAGIGKTLSGRLMIFDSLDFSTHFLNIKSNPENVPVTKLIDYDAFCNPAAHANTIRAISPQEVHDLLAAKRIQLIDVREPFEYELINIGGTNIPLDEILNNVESLKKEIPVVLHCKSGQRSLEAARRLNEKGFNNVSNMTGGLIAWKKEVDPTIKLY